MFSISSTILGIVAARGVFAASFLIMRSLSDDPDQAADFAIVRFLTTALMIPLSIIVGQIVFFNFPLIFVFGFLFSMLLAIYHMVSQIVGKKAWGSARRPDGSLAA